MADAVALAAPATDDTDDTDDPAGAEPRVVDTAVTTLGEAEVGLWQVGPGVLHDVEVDEVFLVLAGAGSVTFADGSVLALHPGVLVQLRAGGPDGLGDHRDAPQAVRRPAGLAGLSQDPRGVPVRVQERREVGQVRPGTCRRGLARSGRAVPWGWVRRYCSASRSRCCRLARTKYSASKKVITGSWSRV